MQVGLSLLSHPSLQYEKASQTERKWKENQSLVVSSQAVIPAGVTLKLLSLTHELFQLLPLFYIMQSCPFNCVSFQVCVTGKPLLFYH